jgi:signal transduction histidine kinase
VLGVVPASDETGPALSALGPPTLVGGTGAQRDEMLVGRDRREILLRVIVDIASDLDLDATLKRIVTGAMELTGARFGALGVRGPDDSLISFVYAGIDEVAVNRIGHHPVGKGVLGLPLSRSGSLQLDDLTAHLAAVGFPEHHPSMDALLGVPIIIRQNVFGSLYLTEPTSRAAFSDADEVAVRELASAAAVAIDNARLFDRVRSTAQWTEASRMITTALLSAVDLHARLQLIAVRACELTEAEQAIVLVPSEADLPVDEVDILVVSTAVGLYADEVLGQWVPVEGSTTGAVFRSGTPVITAAFGHPPQAFTDAGRRPAIVMPLRSEHTVLGVIAVARNSDQPPFDAEHLDLMSDFADHAAMALTLASALEHSRYLTVLADRERIGHDLHDHVIQRLFAAGLDLQGTIARSRSSEITDRLNRTVTDLQTTIQDIRTTIFELHSTGRQRIGFRQRIQAAVADLTENGAVVTTLRISGPMSVIGDDLAGHAESVILEAVSNAVRHSGATQLTVEVAVADELDIMVTDDGCGISADNRRRSGLANMASRAEQIGGHCHLATPSGGGTEVHWTVPLPDL